MLRLLAALTTVAGLFAGNAQSRHAPTPDCLDARQLTEMRQPDSRTLAIADSSGGHFRISLQDDCPALETAQHAMLLAQQGWVCGGPREFVRSEHGDCGVTAIERIDARSYAALARAADRDGTVTLDTVQVTEQRPGQQGFRGSYSYCFNPRHMRGWAEDPQGLIVEMAPQHSGGNRYYRVELSQSCPMLSHSPQLNFVSGVGVGVICGNPGDRLTLNTTGGRRNWRSECTISAVYPRP
jgi:hypothetical protein